MTRGYLEKGVESGVASGIVAGVYVHSRPDQVWVASCGQTRNDVPSDKSEYTATSNTLFDLSSVSKPIGTAALAGVLVQRGWLQWHAPVQRYLPSYPSSQVRVSHLLSHTAGYPAWGPFYKELISEFQTPELWKFSVDERQEKMRSLVLSVEPEHSPGEKAIYSDLSFLVLGYVLEEITQMPLDRAVSKWVFDPMGMQGARYFRTVRPVDSTPLAGVAATEDCPWRGGILQKQVHDDNCWAMGGYGGHAGVFGTVYDLMQFARASFSGFFSREVLQAMWTRVDQPVGCERTLGWDTPSLRGSLAGDLFSQRAVGHWGFTGTSLWIEPQLGLAIALLTNRVHPSRDNEKIKAFRPQFHNLIWEELSEVGLLD